ncbi:MULTISPECIES: DUF6514 family protein [Clostridium]|uniref:Uncharacterized protein n=2 Tax=Clostridium TaxID=1485 RepID=A0A151ALE7_9CLOT|nr:MULTISPECIES: DUF6514 family protein [Clostridium]KYH28464.1 hypothetical protein CLCOL_19560 [Clostridium colicanis DSM 13634]MBE6043022.1 hypothetical protein [Clostridium thermopalmarium]PRR69069.1 hypothetical protein CPAL_25870 [Clostridium thermopalmarium DSM 5974]PVZ26580.1 hypothetical protein LX19_00655 [Clostridium thermopalmarium DSM 5974]
MLVVESLGRTEYHGDVQYHYSYRVIKDKVTFLDGCMKDIQSYGIEVERQDIVNGKLVRIERDSVKCISPHRHKVHELLKMLYDNVVSPIHLIDILGEYIDNYVTDFDEILKDIYIC